MALPGGTVAGACEGALAKEFSAIGSTGKIGELELQKLGGASQQSFDTSLGLRIIDQLVGGVANESKVGYQTLTASNRLQILKDVELMQTREVDASVWHFFTSPVTGLGGPSVPLAQFLEQNGIQGVLH